MPKVKQIWLISSGSYSDYSVHAAFATEELAEQVREVDPAYLMVESREIFDTMPERITEHFITASTNPARQYGPYTSEVEGGWYLWEWSRVSWPWDATTHKNGRPKAVKLGYGKDPAFRVEGRDAAAVRKAVYDLITGIKAGQQL